MRNTFAKTLYECAVADPSIYIVVADISPAGPMAEFRKHAPERFVNVGVAEQVMIGMCAGLALKGCKPFAYTIATFALYRPFEMVRDDLGYQNLPVTVVGITANGFQGVEAATATDFWMPLQNRPELNAWGAPAKSGTFYDRPKWWCLRMIARLRDAPIPIRRLKPELNLSAGVEKVLLKGMERDPEHRYRTAPEFAEAFADAAQTTPNRASRIMRLFGGGG